MRQRFSSQIGDQWSKNVNYMSIQSPIHFFSQTEKKVLDFASILQYIVIMRREEKIGGRMDKSLVAKLKRLNRELLRRRLLLNRKIGAERVEISNVDIANLHIALDVSNSYNDIFELINLM